MAEKKKITPEEHRRQIEEYGKVEFPHYAKFAEVLKRVLEQGCAVSFPEALVQSRPKSVSSFAEKCVRKFDRYRDAAHQMTDLCGGRVIVQTIEQVEAVKQFIEANFAIAEKDDKGLLLSEDKFGYRDMHYIIRLREDRWEALGIAKAEREIIGDRPAEVQVRTWLQHAWADTLHDRMYKTPLKPPADVRRTGGLLAALMEEGDRTFDQMAHGLDGMLANYAAFASIAEVQNEIEVQKLILQNEPNEHKKPALALKLARLMVACGQYAEAAATLEPHRDVAGALRCELLQDLGYTLCKLHRGGPASDDYARGRQFLEETLSLCGQTGCPYVPHLRKRESLHARVLWRLGWAVQKITGEEYRARQYFREAHEHEPENPYYLASMLGLEVAHVKALPETMRTVLRRARQVCREHALAGIELPQAMFTAGRLSLLLAEPYEALGYYARGIRHLLTGKHCQEPDALESEVAWLQLIHRGEAPPTEHRWVYALLKIAGQVKACAGEGRGAKVLVVAGGVASLGPNDLPRIRSVLEVALAAFDGTVISGGTKVGVPGLVGEVAQGLVERGGKRFALLGYIAKKLPETGPRDPRYDKLIECEEEDFSPEQVLRMWSDLLAQGVAPQDVLVAGFGGGKISAVDYHVGLGLGASVAVVQGFGGAADELAADKLWSNPATVPNLLPLPCDAASLRAFVVPANQEFSEAELKKMGMAFHENYLRNSTSRLPPSLKPWDKLDQTYRDANFAQARYAVRILEACGLAVREKKDPDVFKGFTKEEIEQMAELEHGRWNIDRLRGGWRHGPRDDHRQLHNCLVPWPDLKEEIKQYDRWGVIEFPEILAKAGLEVYRP